MEDLTTKILALLQAEKIEPQDMRLNLARVIDELESRLWTKLSLSMPLLYSLKDTVWFNLEHKTSGGKEKGLDNLRLMGSKYPTLMFSANDDVYVSNDNAKLLLPELEDILSKWSNDWTFVQLTTKSFNGWNGGKDNPSPVIIYDPNSGETPSKYGYQYTRPQYTIFDPKGDYITTEKQETVLCAIEMKLGTYGREPMMRSLLERLIDACKKAIKDDKGILLDIERYDYMS